MYKIKFTSSRVKKQLTKLPFNIFKRVDKVLINLAKDPFSEGALKLKGLENLYRIRISEYRIIYEINHKNQEIVIARIMHRKDVYKF